MAKNRDTAGKAPSQRQLKVGEEIRRTLSETLSRGEIHDPELNQLYLSVGEVRVSPDLTIATAYVSPLAGKGSDITLDLLKRNAHELRKSVAKKMSLRFAPELRFRLDDTFDLLDETRRMFSQEAVRRDLEK